ncbi:MAG: hypothetical protein LUF28_09415 [Clostridiales bacterium]|nr:hypothetical protein [Clostridiales bacterium]
MANGRPGSDAWRAGSSKKSVNPFSAWRERRKEQQWEMEESVARKVTDDTAHNESLIIEELSSIDFAHSRLPQKDLEYKSNSKQPCGDLEYAARYLQQVLLKDPQIIQMDIREIDQKLITLATLFRQAVEQGDKHMAYAAKGALARGLMDIRTRIPQNQPELAKQFVELNAKYLEEWITLVNFAQSVDHLEKDAENLQADQQKAEERNKKKLAEIKSMLKDDLEKGEAFQHILNHDTQEDRAHWTQTQREVHKMLVDLRLSQIKMDLSGQRLVSYQMKLSAKENELRAIQAKLTTLPVVEDPDLMNKYNEMMDELFQELTESDAEIDEILKSADEIEGRLKMLEKAPGAVRAREVAAEQAKKALEQIKHEDEEYVKSAQRRNSERLKKLGLKSQEELDELRRQAEEQEQNAFHQEEAAEEEVEQNFN